MNHTSGDWEMVVAPKFGPEDYEGITIESPDTETIICEIAGGLPLIEILGNAKLIEKAPKMLEALKELIDAQPETSPIWDNRKWELARDFAKNIINEIEKGDTL